MEQLKGDDHECGRASSDVVMVKPKPAKGLASKGIDWLECVLVKMMHDSKKPLHYLSGNFGPVDETPPISDLPVIGHLPECLNGEFVRVGPNPKFDGDGMIHGMRIKDGKATYVSRFVKTSKLKQEEYFGGSKFMKVGDLKGMFGLVTVYMQLLRTKLKVLDDTYGHGNANTALIYHNGKLLALNEADKPYAIKVLEDGDLQTIGLLDYDKRLTHSFTAHPKVDPVTGEMFTFGYAFTAPYITYRVISKDGVMQDPVPITIPAPVMMHDFAITDNYAIFMDLPLYFRPKEMVKENKIAFSFDPTKKARFGILPRYAKNELLIRWFELPNCFIFHNEKDWGDRGLPGLSDSCLLDVPALESGVAGVNVDVPMFGESLSVAGALLLTLLITIFPSFFKLKCRRLGLSIAAFSSSGIILGFIVFACFLTISSQLMLSNSCMLSLKKTASALPVLSVIVVLTQYLLQ
ncbi:Dixin [Castilleja foliolosa]|uniref:carotenoid 9,10-dioxygenase n=1 Tax=Castilleja foliolosa TaxID=1961234 RepID=A0ABD3BZG9_9LAMI